MQFRKLSQNTRDRIKVTREIATHDVNLLYVNLISKFKLRPQYIIRIALFLKELRKNLRYDGISKKVELSTKSF